MPLLLLIETSSKNCSVALADEHRMLAQRSASAEHYVHAEQLHSMLEEMMQETTTSWSMLSAVAVGRGPGSYTGLRIGVSAAKGLCFALGIPLIAIDTTHLLAHHASRVYTDARVIIPMIDARRMEVYMAHFDGNALRLSEDASVIIEHDAFQAIAPEELVLVGDGVEKCIAWLHKSIRLLPIQPHAHMMQALALRAWNDRRFEDVAYFEPFYLKEYTPGITRKTIL